MNLAEQIIMCILASALAVFLIIGIVFLVKLIKFLGELRGLTDTLEDLAQNANGVAHNLKNITYAGTVANAAKVATDLANTLRGAKKNRDAKKAAQEAEEALRDSVKADASDYHETPEDL